MEIKYDINIDHQGNDPEDVLFRNPERLSDLAAKMQQGITDHDTLQSLKNTLISEMNVSWEGEAKKKFDQYAEFMQLFITDLKPALEEYKKVLEGVSKLIDEVKTNTPSCKKDVAEVTIP